MVTHDRQLQIVGSINTINVTFYGLSTDAKPTEGVGNGSCFIEMDTGKGYFFDVENIQWHEQSGGSGGGGSGETMFIITKDSGEGSLDKTWNEIKAAHDAGKMCVIRSDNSYDGYADKTQEVVTYINGGNGSTYYVYSVFADQIGNPTSYGYYADTADGTLYMDVD